MAQASRMEKLQEEGTFFARKLEIERKKMVVIYYVLLLLLFLLLYSNKA